MSNEIHMTALPLNECLRTLQMHVYSFPNMLRFNFTPPAKGTIIAKVQGDRFRLFAQGVRYVNNSFVPFFYGRLEPAGAGTRIVGHFQMNPIVRIFMTIWFGGLALVSLGLLAAALSGKLQPDVPLPLAMGMPLTMLLFGFCLVRFGQWLARGQRRSMEEFIRHDLRAELQQNGNQNTPCCTTFVRREENRCP